MSRSRRYDPDEDDDVPVRDDRREARRVKRERLDDQEGQKENRRGSRRSE